MRPIQLKTLASLGILISSAALSIPLISPSLAAGGGSHKTLRMCAKIQYTYINIAKERISGTTNPEECGRNFRQQHGETSERKVSREEACKRAWTRLPRLQQGELWKQRSCKPFQQG